MPITNNPLPTLTECVLLAIVSQSKQPKQMQIYEKYIERIPHQVSLQSVYATLDRMRQKGLLVSWYDDEDKPRLRFEVTNLGYERLMQAVGALRSGKVQAKSKRR